eukprot:scaffold132098_cov18-Tisochrysis_lutea.AAC.2
MSDVASFLVSPCSSCTLSALCIMESHQSWTPWKAGIPSALCIMKDHQLWTSWKAGMLSALCIKKGRQPQPPPPFVMNPNRLSEVTVQSLT